MAWDCCFGLNLMLLFLLMFELILKEDFMKTRKEKAKQGKKGSKKGKLGFWLKLNILN